MGNMYELWGGDCLSESKTALVTGITGQDGRLLTKLLLSKGYEVTGILRKVVGRDMNVIPKSVEIIEADITDYASLKNALDVPGMYFDEVYHLAAQSDVAYSFEHPKETYDININGTLNLLSALHTISNVYFAGTSELYGQPPTKPQNEEYPMRPKSPYAVSKLAAYWTCRNYREAYKEHIWSGILFNHESEIRGKRFVTRKITSSIAQFLENGRPFELGNLEAKKDWGYAPEYVEGMWRMLQHDNATDYVLGTGEMHTVREFLEEALRVAGIDFTKAGNGFEEKYYDERGKVIVSVNFEMYRPSEADNYMADASKAKRELGWEPKTKFKDLVYIMMKNDLQQKNLYAVKN